jgi:hypothetical protein
VNDEAASDGNRRTSFSHRAVFTVFGLTLAFAFAGGLLIYFRYVAYGRVAARHLPDDTRLAARIDVETLLISDPIRTRLLPLFDQGAPRTDLKPRHDRFRAHTGVELGRDLREIVLSVSDAGWVLVFGGKFPRSGLVQGLETTLTEEPTPCEFRDGVLQVRNGPAIGQATDGALVVASDAARLRLALRGGEAYLRLGLPPEGAGGFGLRVAPEPPPGFAEFDHVYGSIQLGQQVEVDVAVHLLPGASSEPTRIAAAFATLAASAPAGSGARRALETAKIVPHREGEVGVQLRWTRDELNQGVEWLASLLTTQFAHPSTRP